jgi:hypothetical protein
MGRVPFVKEKCRSRASEYSRIGGKGAAMCVPLSRCARSDHFCLQVCEGGYGAEIWRMLGLFMTSVIQNMSIKYLEFLIMVKDSKCKVFIGFQRKIQASYIVFTIVFHQEKVVFWLQQPYATIVLITCEDFDKCKLILKPCLKLIVQRMVVGGILFIKWEAGSSSTHLGNLEITGSNNTIVKLWGDSTCLYIFVGHIDTVCGLGVMLNAGFLSGSHDGSKGLWALLGKALWRWLDILLLFVL